MPKIGIFRLRMFLSKVGAFFEITLEGPPDKIIALGFIRMIVFNVVLDGKTSEKT